MCRVLLHNGFYGNRSLLSVYAGQKNSGQPIFGSVIHGWFPVPEMECVSGAPRMSGVG
jgi:hypothetical protein